MAHTPTTPEAEAPDTACTSCSHSVHAHTKPLAAPEPVQPLPTFEPPYRFRNIMINLDACRACPCPGYTQASPAVAETLRRLGAHFHNMYSQNPDSQNPDSQNPDSRRVTNPFHPANPQLTMGGVVDKFVRAMLLEGIDPQLVDRATNRVVFGHPDGMEARIEIDDVKRRRIISEMFPDRAATPDKPDENTTPHNP